MFLITKVNRKDNFDSMRFRHYTKPGDKFDFVVWPALLLQENGPVVCKGVAQALDSNKSKATLYESENTPRSPPESSRKPEPVSARKTPNAAIRGTPWGSQQFSNRGTPSVDLPPFPDEEQDRIQGDLPREVSPTMQHQNGKIHSRTATIPSPKGRREGDGKGGQKKAENTAREAISPGQSQRKAESPQRQAKMSPHHEDSALTSAWKERHSQMKPTNK